MSVYTHVARHELDLLLANYNLGTLLRYEGIPDGVINSNYFVDTSTGRFVLTLFETIDAVKATDYLALMQFYASLNLPVPMPIANHYGQTLIDLNGKPAVLAQRLPGKCVIQPTPQHCASLGMVMGKLHREGRGFPQQMHDDHGRQWQRDIAAKLMPHLTEQQAKLLRQELKFQNLYRLTDLPMGVIHADLFRDNVLFHSDRAYQPIVSAVLDWYDSCTSVLLYDIAVVANDWCVDVDGQLLVEPTQALLNAYHKERPLTAIEHGAWPVLLRSAAMRFWLSRLDTTVFPRVGKQVTHKDPGHMLQVLQDRIARHDEFYDMWLA